MSWRSPLALPLPLPLPRGIGFVGFASEVVANESCYFNGTARGTIRSWPSKIHPHNTGSVLLRGALFFSGRRLRRRGRLASEHGSRNGPPRRFYSSCWGTNYCASVSSSVVVRERGRYFLSAVRSRDSGGARGPARHGSSAEHGAGGG